MEPELKIQIRRDAEIITHPFTDFFKGFEKVEAVRRLFDEKTEEGDIVLVAGIGNTVGVAQ